MTPFQVLRMRRAASAGPTAYPTLAIAPSMTRTSTNPLLIPYPGGISAGQVGVIQAVLYDAVSNNNVTPPAGWDVLANAFMNGVNGVVHCVLGRRFDGSESGSVSLSALPAYTPGSDTFEGQMAVFAGCKQTGAYYEGLINQTGQSVNMQGGAVTTLGEYRWLLHFGATVGAGTRTSTPAVGYTEQWENNCTTGAGPGTLFMDSKQIRNPTAEAAATHLLSASARWHECAFALLPVGA
jgi:hypothetical protein